MPHNPQHILPILSPEEIRARRLAGKLKERDQFPAPDFLERLGRLPFPGGGTFEQAAGGLGRIEEAVSAPFSLAGAITGALTSGRSYEARELGEQIEEVLQGKISPPDFAGRLIEKQRAKPPGEQIVTELPAMFFQPVKALKQARAGITEAAKVAETVAGVPLRPAMRRAVAARPAGAAEAAPPGPPIAVSGAPELERSLKQAAEVVRQDKPGVIGRLADRIPGLGQLRRWERPGLAMPENILTAHIAETGAKSEFLQKAFATERLMLRDIEQAFGKQALSGGKVDVRFLGTPEEAVNPITGTFKDIADNPALYEINPAQRSVLDALETRNTQLLDLANKGYATDIGRFQGKPGSAFLPNVDVSDKTMEAFSGNLMRAVASGRSKTRIFETARERMGFDPTFKPELDVRVLLRGLDESKARAASGQVFRQGVGGKTRLEVMQETHPALATRMEALRGKVQGLRGTLGRLDAKTDDAIGEFLGSPIEGADLTALRDSLDVKVGANAVGKQGPNFGKTPAALRKEIASVREEIRSLKPMWEAANLKGYQFVQEGLFRYFPNEEAQAIRQVRQVSDNGLVNFLDDLRGTVLGGDLSPIVGIQTPLGFLFDPIGTGRQWARGLRAPGRAFSPTALAEDIAKEPQTWGDFAFSIGHVARPGLGNIRGAPREFGGGLLSRIPGYTKVNDAMYNAVLRQSKRLFDDLVRGLEKFGLSHETAIAAAGDQVTKVYPLASPARLGQSPAKFGMLRAGVTSISFIRKPIEMTLDAGRAYSKLATGQKLTPREGLAVRLFTTMAASVATVTATTQVLNALGRGKDPLKALGDNFNADSSDFLTVAIGNQRIPIGGPYRSLIKAIAPRPVGGAPVPLPFWGLAKWARGKLTPGLSTQLQLLFNEDFSGRTIVKGQFPENILRALAYEVEGLSPATAGQIIQNVRTGQGLEETISQTVGQFFGGSVFPERGVQLPSEQFNWQRLVQRLPFLGTETPAPPRKHPIGRTKKKKILVPAGR